MMNDLGITNLIQTLEFAHTYDKYVALYKIDGEKIYEHELTSCDFRFILTERMRYGHVIDSLLLENADCLKWCKQANKLIGISRLASVFLPDDIFKLICDAYVRKGNYISVNTFKEI